MEKHFETSPVESVENDEYLNMILNFSSYVCIFLNKKINFPSILVNILENDNLMDIYVEFTDTGSKRDSIRFFLRVDDSMVSSKYLRRVIKNEK